MAACPVGDLARPQSAAPPAAMATQKRPAARPARRNVSASTRHPSGRRGIHAFVNCPTSRLTRLRPGAPRGPGLLDGRPLPHGANELTGPGAPLREHADGLGEGDVDRMHPVARQDVDAAGHRRRRRGDEHRVGAVLEFLDDQCRHQRVLDLHQCGLQRLLLALPGQALGQPAQEGVAWEPLEHGPLARILRAEAGTGAHDQADHEAGADQEDDRHDLAELDGCRNPFRHGLQQSQQPLDGLREQQDSDIDRQDDQQAADQCGSGEFRQGLHFGSSA